MSDIYDIKGLYAGEVATLLLALFFLIIGSLFYFVFFHKTSGNSKVTENNLDKNTSSDFSVQEALKKLQQKLPKIQEKEFLDELDYIFRKYFENKSSVHLEDKTFTQLDVLQIMSAEETALYKQIYTYKYAKNYEFNKETLIENVITTLSK